MSNDELPVATPVSRESAEVAVLGRRDANGFVPIGDYGVLGDGRGAALVASDGTIDWWAAPRLDSPPPFAALLDPERGGSMVLRPSDPAATMTRSYLPQTNVLQTTYTTSSGRVRVTDSLNSGSAGELPWSELARRIEGLAGSMELVFSVIPGDGLRRWEPWAEGGDAGPIAHAGTVTMGVRCSPQIITCVGVDRIGATFVVAEGQRLIAAIVAADDDPLFLCPVNSIDHRIDLTIASWREWSTQVQWDGDGREQIVRSALALKTLMIARTGAVAAAVTTSLPERVGGDKNWDYRFSWIRDTAFTIDALAVLGLQEEVHAAVSWLLRAINDNGPDVHVMYTLQGTVPTEVEQPPVPGYRHSRPVMIGNDAASQTQLGVYGDLFGTIANWVFGGHVLDTRSARQLADLADRCADLWQHDDAGIWELQTNRPYTSSKMNCWRALDAAARMARAGHLVGTGQRWQAAAETIHRWVERHCWSATKKSYTFYAGTEDLDASVLLGAPTGFDHGTTMSSTIDALGRELSAGALLYRYTGVHHEEQAFTACAFWRVQALARVGRHDEARKLLDQLGVVENPLGLMSEMCAPDTGHLWGNIPQALSHLAFIRAAHAVKNTPSSRRT